MRRFFADLAFYLGMVFVVASMFIPLFKETVVRDGATTPARLALCNGYMWAFVIAFLFIAVLFQIKKMRGYASVLSLIAAAGDGAAIFLFCNKQNYAQTAFNNSDSLIAQISNYSGISEVAMTQTSGIYWVVAAEIILIIVSIVNLVVKDDSL